MFRNFGKNAILYSIGAIGVRAGSFLMIPIYTHSLTIDDYGLLAVLLQTVQILMIIMSLGSRTALVRFAKEYEDKNQIGALLGTSIFINVAMSMVVTIIVTICLSPLFRDVLHTGRARSYLFLTCGAAAFNCLAVHLVTYYRAGQDGLKATVANLSAAALLVLLTLIFVGPFDLGVHGALLAQVLIYGLLSGFLLIILSSKIRMSVSLRLAWELIKFGMPLILVMAGGLVTQTSGMYFMSHFRGLEEVSIYALGSKMAQIAEMILILPFVMAYEPFIYSHIGDAGLWKAVSRLLTYLMIAFVFVASGIVFIARDLLSVVAPPAYGSAYFVIFMIVPVIAFRGVHYVGESLLYIEKKTHLVGVVVAAFSLAAVGLNYVLVWRFGMYGAIAAFAVTTVGTGTAVLKLGLGMSLVRIDKQRLCITAALLIGLLGTVYALHDASRYIYYSVIPAGICLGTLLLYTTSFVKDDERRAIQLFIGRASRLRSVLHA